MTASGNEGGAPSPADAATAGSGSVLTDPRSSLVVMILTYVVGGVGLALGASTVNATPPELSLSCLLAVGAVGVLSFVRHALLHRSDAARMGWDYGRRNNFQIEVGIANLAWGVVAILAVALNWGVAVEAAMFLVLGGYIGSVAVMNLASPGGQRRNTSSIIATGAFGVFLLYVGIAGITAVT